MNRSNSNRQLVVQWTCLTVVLLIALISSGHNSVRCQFLQPQSHLGRLVQSITSPLVLASSSGPSGDSDSSYDPESSSPSGPEALGGVDQSRQHYGAQQAQPARGYYRQQQQQQQQEQEETAGGPQHFQQYRAQHNQAAGLQQAPSQQRGVPQQYYGDGGDGRDDEDSGAPTNNRHHKQQAADGSEQYQMGAYLGPTIDDKEIQGAFNSNDDKDDDEAAGYEGPPTEGARGQRGSGASAFAASQPDAAGYAPQAGGHDGGRDRMMGYGGQRGGQANFDDELGVDEDDEPAAGPARRQPRFKSSSGVNQATAASQYHQRNQPSYPRTASQQQQQQQSSGMMAAANGYSPMGAAGPFDLSGLMAAAGGVVNGAQGYEVYNGDGSYPGQGYYQQQGNQGQGRRNQAASMNSPYGYGGYGPMGYGPQQQQQQGGRNADQDDAENDQDED